MKTENTLTKNHLVAAIGLHKKENGIEAVAAIVNKTAGTTNINRIDPALYGPIVAALGYGILGSGVVRGCVGDGTPESLLPIVTVDEPADEADESPAEKNLQAELNALADRHFSARRGAQSTTGQDLKTLASGSKSTAEAFDKMGGALNLRKN